MAHLNIHRTRELELPRRKLGLRWLIGWQLVHARTGIVVRESRLQPNLITDSGMDRLGGGLGLYNDLQYCGVGADNTAPAFNQTSLLSPVGTRVNSNGGFADVTGVGAANAYAYRRITRVFLEANANGNLTEVGFFTASTDGVMLDRQLLKDDLGNPTTIVKTSDYQLRVILEYRVYGMLTPVTETVSISGTSYDVSTKLKDYQNLLPDIMGGWSTGGRFGTAKSQDTLPAFGGSWGGSSSNGTVAVAPDAYVGGSYTRGCTFNFEPNEAVFAGGVGGLAWFPYNSHGGNGSVDVFASVFSPKILKTNLQRLRLHQYLTWARV